jgi:hypothetical protein
MSCPLCGADKSLPWFEDRRREYLFCECCGLVFVPSRFHLGLAAEKAEYDLHRNDPADSGYRRFLSRLAEPLCARLDSPGHGLDFGSGPGPTLSLMLAEAGHAVEIYDPFYAPDTAVLDRDYDFITATEVVEHLSQPREVLERLWARLRPGAYLGVMTKMVLSREAFATWHYKNDPTHICFFSRTSWSWWAARRGVEAEFLGDDVVLLRR